MKANDLLLAFNDVDDDILLKLEEDSIRIVPYRRRIVIALVAALLLALLLGAVISSHIWGRDMFQGDDLQSYFAYRWWGLAGETITPEHADLLEERIRQLNISQTVSGVTVTVESVYADDLNVFAFLRISGVEASKDHWYGFDEIDYDPLFDDHDKQYSLWFSPGNLFLRVDGNGDILSLAIINLDLHDNSLDRQLPCDVTLKMTNLMQEPRSKDSVLLAEGTWEFQFSVQLNCGKRIELPNAEVNGYIVKDGVPLDKLPTALATIRNIELTGAGVSYYHDQGIHIESDAYLILKNGQEIRSGAGGTTRKPDGTHFKSHKWQIPVNLDDVAAIRIGDTVIELPT